MDNKSFINDSETNLNFPYEKLRDIKAEISWEGNKLIEGWNYMIFGSKRIPPHLNSKASKQQTEPVAKSITIRINIPSKYDRLELLNKHYLLYLLHDHHDEFLSAEEIYNKHDFVFNYASVHILQIHLSNGKISYKNGPAIIFTEFTDEEQKIQTFYVQDNLLHRLDGPAVETAIYTIYAQNGLFHRNDGPAVIINEKPSFGYKQVFYMHFVNGLLHNNKGPAVFSDNPTDFVYAINNKVHRPHTEGPAICYTNKYETNEKFVENEILHNENGPAIIYDAGYFNVKIWFQKGIINNSEGPAYVLFSRSKQIYVKVIYYENGLLHRLNGPAVYDKDDQYWYKRGLLHNIDGPAVIKKNYHAYYYMGHLHRTDGPAFISNKLLKWSILGNSNYLKGFSAAYIKRKWNTATKKYTYIIKTNDNWPYNKQVYNTLPEAQQALRCLKNPNFEKNILPNFNELLKF